MINWNSVQLLKFKHLTGVTDGLVYVSGFEEWVKFTVWGGCSVSLNMIKSKPSSQLAELSMKTGKFPVLRCLLWLCKNNKFIVMETAIKISKSKKKRKKKANYKNVFVIQHMVSCKNDSFSFVSSFCGNLCQPAAHCTSLIIMQTWKQDGCSHITWQKVICSMSQIIPRRTSKHTHARWHLMMAWTLSGRSCWTPGFVLTPLLTTKTGGWYKHGNNCSLIRGIFQQVRAMPHVKDKSIICGRACLYGLMQMAISVGTATLLIDWCAGYPGWPSPALPIFTRWLLNVGLCAS